MRRGTIEVRPSPAQLGGRRPPSRGDGEWRAGRPGHHGPGWSTTCTDGLRRRYRVRLEPHGAFVNGPEGQSTFALRAEDDAAERGG